MLGHVLMMSVVITPLPCAPISPFDVPAPKEEAVGNQGTDLGDVQSVTRQVINMRWAWVLTAAFAMNIEYAKVPLSLGIP